MTAILCGLSAAECAHNCHWPRCESGVEQTSGRKTESGPASTPPASAGHHGDAPRDLAELIERIAGRSLTQAERDEVTGLMTSALRQMLAEITRTDR